MKNGYGFGRIALHAKNVYTASQGESCLVADNGFIFGCFPEETLLLSYSGDAAALTLPSSVTYKNNQINSYVINSKAFFENNGLVSVSIPSAVGKIGSNAFDDCISLESVTFSEGLESIDYSAFANCCSLKSIALPDGLKEIGGAAFSMCVSLEAVVIPVGIAQIDYETFQGCSSLKSVGLPVGLLAINENAFERCTSLGTVLLPESLERIGFNAFAYCCSLEQITIPEKVEEICENAFINCSLKEMHINPSSCIIEDAAPGYTNVILTGGIGRKYYFDLTSMPCSDSDEEKYEQLLIGIINGILGTDFADYYEYYMALDSSIEEKNYCPEIEQPVIDADLTIYAERYNETPEEKLPTPAYSYCMENEFGFVDVNGESFIDLFADSETADGNAELWGYTEKCTKVTVYIDNAPAGSVISSPSGKWAYSLSLKAPVEGTKYSVKAKVHEATSYCAESDSVEVTYSPNAIIFDALTIYHRYTKLCFGRRDARAAAQLLSLAPSEPLSFTASFINSAKIAELRIVSTTAEGKKYLPAAFDSVNGVWVASGFFDESNMNYVPGAITFEVNGKELAYPVININYIIDPSGYVYEAVASNRVEGAQATIFYLDSSYNPVEWNAETANQLNPLLTLPDGTFAWDVPVGKWAVRVTKSGYETAWSDWLDVPPVHTDVNIGLVTKLAPQLECITAYPGGVDITFTQYMDITSVKDADNITVLLNGNPVSGAWSMYDTEKNPVDSRYSYARSFRFESNELVSGSVKVVCDGVKNYAGIENAEELSLTSEISEKTDSMNSTASLVLDYSGSDKLYAYAFPASSAQGKTVNAASLGSAVTLKNTTAVFDNTGKAEFTVEAATPGSAEIQFKIAGTSLSCASKVTVNAPEVVCNHQKVTDKAVASTCTVPGLTEGSHCSYCGDILVAQTAAPLKAHTPVQIPAVPSSCTSTGKTAGSRCSVCGEILIAQQNTALKAHTPVQIPAVPASCASTGKTAGSRCSVCGVILTAQQNTPITEHTPGGWTVIKSASYTENGIRIKKCTVCGKELVRENIPLLVSPTLKPLKEELEASAGEILTGLTDNTAVRDAVKMFENSDRIIITDAHGNCLSDSDIVATGCKITLTDAAGKTVDTLKLAVKGDADGNGTVNSADARLALRQAVMLESFTGEYLSACDIDGKGVSSADARLILRYAVKLEKTLNGIEK